jgi:hypothetical protein
MIFADGFNPVAAKSYLEKMLQFEKLGCEHGKVKSPSFFTYHLNN